MPLLALALVIQILIGGVLLYTPPNSPPARAIRHSLKQVLGTSLLAQDDTPTDTPTPDQTTQPTDTPTPTDQSITPTETASPTPQEVQPITPETQPTTQENPTMIPAEPSLSTNPTLISFPEDTLPITSETVNPVVMNPDDAINNTDNIASPLVDTAKKEDDLLAKASPEDKTNLLVSFSNEDVRKINTNLASNSFASTAFLTQRLADNLVQAQRVLDTSQSPNTQAMKQTLRNFCQQTDSQLKTQQLQVPENLEQDIEIARGTCIILQQ